MGVNVQNKDDILKRFEEDLDSLYMIESLLNQIDELIASEEKDEVK